MTLPFANWASFIVIAYGMWRDNAEICIYLKLI